MRCGVHSFRMLSGISFCFNQAGNDNTLSNQQCCIPLTFCCFFSHIRKFIGTGTVGAGAGILPDPTHSTPLHDSNPCLVNCKSNTLAARSKHVKCVCNPTENVISIAMFTVSRYFAIFVPSYASTVRRTTTVPTGVGKAHPDHSSLPPKCRSLSMERWVPSPAPAPTRKSSHTQVVHSMLIWSICFRS